MRRIILGSVLIALAPAAAAIAALHLTTQTVASILEDILALYERAGRLM